MPKATDNYTQESHWEETIQWLPLWPMRADIEDLSLYLLVKFQPWLYSLFLVLSFLSCMQTNMKLSKWLHIKEETLSHSLSRILPEAAVCHNWLVDEQKQQ